MVKTVAMTALLSLGLLMQSPSAHAKDRLPDRWFEVEVILFTRTIAEDSIRETFEQKVKPIRYRRQRDLLSKFHYPDTRNLQRILGNCSVEQMLQPEPFQLEDWPTLPEEQPAIVQQELYETDLYSSDDPYQSVVEPELTAQLQPLEPFTLTMPEEAVVLPFDDPFGINHCEKDPFAIPRFWYETPEQAKVDYGMYPRVIIAGEKTYNNYVHLMSPANFKLREIYRTLRRQPDIRPILHTAWREPAGAEKYSRATRLYAGYDYTDKYDFQGQPIVEDALTPEPEPQGESSPSTNGHEVSVVDNIERLLAEVDKGAKINYRTQRIETVTAEQDDGPQPNEVREIDGLFRIYIDPFNYLHIVAEFNVRREVNAPLAGNDTMTVDLNAIAPEPVASSDAALQMDGDKVLKNYYFNQTRRVITRQLHYFDHPYMGLIVQIRRHGW